MNNFEINQDIIKGEIDKKKKEQDLMYEHAIDNGRKKKADRELKIATLKQSKEELESLVPLKNSPNINDEYLPRHR